MKTKILLSILVVFMTTLSIFSQECIVVQEGGNITVYYTNCLDQAIDEASDGAVIYLSGGYYSMCNPVTEIDKKLHFIGAGYHPSSTIATGTTNIVSTIKLVPGADGTSITGIRFNDLTASSDEITIWRCYFIKVETTGPCKDWVIDECIFNVINGTSANKFINLQLSRSINTVMTSGQTTHSVRYVNNSDIFNNIFLSNSSYRFDYCNNNTISNNIFYSHGSYFYYSSSYNTTYNNLLSSTYNSLSSNDNFDSNSLLNQTLTNHFVQYSNGDNFKFDANYRIKEGSVAKEYGTDGTDLGIYGTSEPYKDGAITFNPYIEQAIIATKSVDGGIKVKIQVEAQDR